MSASFQSLADRGRERTTRESDSALHAAKSAGRARVVVFEPASS